MDCHIARNGQQLGVFAESEVQSGLASGQFMPGDLYWTEGMAEWQPLSSRFAVSLAAPAFSSGAASAQSFNPYAAPQASIVSSAFMPQLNLASRGVRLGAKILDSFIIMAVMILPMIPAFIAFAQAAEKNGKLENNFPVHALYWFGAAFLASLGMLVWNGIWLGKYGQTVGKRMLGIRVVCFPSGLPAGAAKAFWLRAVVNYFINCIVPFYGLVDACFIFREDKRCVHDLISETTVVVDETSK
ncbi:MAG: hypothetical protein JWR15_4504 [Prosthecobacter sp.]|nr:hypothetical protein [Prosthecobacter sp.]